jgi:5-hydroxyisourate hydrolase
LTSITTHVLDISRGMPATGVTVTLYQTINGARVEVNRKVTDSDGRIGDLFAAPIAEVTVFYLEFDTAAYFAGMGTDALYPKVEICFRAAPNEKRYHLPLLLSPFGYSTYRGS